MSDSRRAGDVSSRRPARQAWSLALVVMLASAAVSAVASSGGPARAAARVVAADGSHPVAATVSRSNPVARSGAVGSPQGALSAAGAVPGSVAAPTSGAVPASEAAPRAAVPTMSMDAPIQGGLTAHEEQAIAARLVSVHQIAPTAPQSKYWTPAAGRSAVARAQSWLGMPYSWAAGTTTGPTLGQCDPGSGGDLDCHVVGFDCSGLAMYAWGVYLALPHLAAAQRTAGGFHPTLEQLLPGDLVFFSGYLPSGTGHVAIYAGAGMVIEAPQSGSVVRRSALADLIAYDGAYRGAVRPLTGRTPTLVAPRVTVPAAGGPVTLRGVDLANVNAVYLDGVAVRQFAAHSDTAIVFRAPAHVSGPASVTVSTSWQARSQPVILTYATPHPSSPATTPGSPGSTTSPGTPETSPATSSTSTGSTPVTPTAPPFTTPSRTPTTPPSTPPASSTPTTAGPSSANANANGSSQPSTAGSTATG